MKKRQLAILLSSCLLISSLNPLTVFAGEMDEPSSVSEQDTLDVLLDGDEIENVEIEDNEEIEDNDDTEEYVMSAPESLPNEEQLIDSYEIEKIENTCNDPISLYESEDEGFTQVAQGVPIEFKYDGTTLHFRLQKNAAPTPMPDLKRVAGGIWVREHQAEAQNVTKIVIGEGITALGNHNFEGISNKYFNKVTEVELPSTVNKIGDYTFQRDLALQSIDLSNVTYIGDTALART